jgi:hypothetical protein
MLTAIAAVVCEVVFQMKVPAQINEAISTLKGQPSDTVFLVGIALGCISIAMALISAVGMYRFKTSAPKLALNSTLLGIFASTLLGAGLSGAITATLSYVSTVLWGAVLAIGHTSTYASYKKADKSEFGSEG